MSDKELSYESLYRDASKREGEAMDLVTQWREYAQWLERHLNMHIVKEPRLIDHIWVQSQPEKE